METVQKTIKVDGLCILPSEGLVQSDLGSFRLAPVNMNILVELILTKGQVVSRRHLFNTAWPIKV